MKKIARAFIFNRTKGFYVFVRESIDRIVDNYYEMYFNVDTKGYVHIEDLEIDHHESIGYGTVYYRYMINTLSNLEVDTANSTLLDFGCGKGRVLVYAASCQYQKIIGVELSKIIEIARENIKKMKHRKTRDVLLEQCDAQNFKIPSSVNIIYFYNPFVGLSLEKVIENIHLSYKNSPRKIYMIFFNNDEFEKIIIGQKWITKTYQSQPHPDISCGLYETDL